MQTKTKLFIMVMAFIVSGVNFALAERADAIPSLTEEARACHQFNCTEGGDVQCSEVECGSCEEGAGQEYYCTLPTSVP